MKVVEKKVRGEIMEAGETEGARRATGVSAQIHCAAHLLFDILTAPSALYLADRLAL